MKCSVRCRAKGAIWARGVSVGPREERDRFSGKEPSLILHQVHDDDDDDDDDDW